MNSLSINMCYFGHVKNGQATMSFFTHKAFYLKNINCTAVGLSLLIFLHRTYMNVSLYLSESP